jgi:formamidopyrimidine-DNA glycosylase
MPELPEVDAARVLVRRVAAGRTISGVWCARDPIVFEALPPQRFRRALLGRRVLGVGRHGKHLWLELDERPWPCFHFGMTGGFHAPRAHGVRLVSSGSREGGDAWPPRFAKLQLTFDDGGELVMSDARRLGRIRLRTDPRAESPIRDLGFDALLGLPPLARFADLLAERSAPVKALLLDQSFAAGVGNWIADEVLYQARIAPRRPARSLSRDEARRLRRALQSVVGRAVAARADSDRFPRAWLFHHRWGRDADAVTARGEKIRHDTIGGRTTAWVPAVQR